jgi:transcriptional regulator with XRE-family HTH domain
MAINDADGLNVLSAATGRKIKALRQRQGLSQASLAARHVLESARMGLPIRVTRIMVAATEAGDRHIKLDELPGYCAALGVGLEQLMGDAAPPDMFPQRSPAVMDYATLADPDRLTAFLLSRLEPMIRERVEAMTRESLRRSLEGVLGDA